MRIPSKISIQLKSRSDIEESLVNGICTLSNLPFTEKDASLCSNNWYLVTHILLPGNYFLGYTTGRSGAYGIYSPMTHNAFIISPEWIKDIQILE